jgi:uncharacterized protein (DUF427 family)
MTITLKTQSGQQLAQGELGKTVLSIEGNYYFDKSAVDFSLLKMKDEGQQYTCPIKKGTCDYYNLVDTSGNVIIDEIGWIYEKVTNTLFQQIAGKVAFYGNKGLVFEKV